VAASLIKCHHFPACPSLQAPLADSSEEGLAASGSRGDSLDDGDLPELTETRRQRRRREQAEKKAASRHKKERKRKVLPELSRLLLVVGVMLPDPTADSIWHNVSPCYSAGNGELSPDLYALAHNSRMRMVSYVEAVLLTSFYVYSVYGSGMLPLGMWTQAKTTLPKPPASFGASIRTGDLHGLGPEDGKPQGQAQHPRSPLILR
jgi:hypothetical protein